MKRFLLSLLIVPLLLIGGFSSAYVYQDAYCYCDRAGQCTMSWSDLPDGTLGFKSLLPYTGYSNPLFISFENPHDILNVYGDFYLKFSSNDTIFRDGVIMFSDVGFNSSNDTIYQAVCQGNGNGNMEFHYQWILPDPPLVPGTFDNFTPVIDGISDVTTEFIPYVVYIGIGTLLVTLGFIAVKWLVNWLVRKITVIFKSKRG